MIEFLAALSTFLIFLLSFTILDWHLRRRIPKARKRKWYVNSLGRASLGLVIISMIFSPWVWSKWVGISMAVIILVERLICSVRFLLLAKPLLIGVGGNSIPIDQRIAGYLYFILVPMIRRYIYFIILCSLISTGVEEATHQSFYEISHPSGIKFIDLLYFTIVTATTLGYGDILPVSVFSRVLTSIVALFGIYYIGVGVATTSVYFSKIVTDTNIKDGDE